MKEVKSITTVECSQPEKEDSKIYISPHIVLELELETKAGSSLGLPDLFPND